MEGVGVHLDFETRSVTDLVKAGVYRYAEDPTTRPWGFTYWFDDDPQLYRWRPGYADPVRLLEHVRNGGRFIAHGAQFERTIWNNVVCRWIAPHWPRLTIRQQDCTMARAASISHPQDLDRLGVALKMTNRKDMVGSALMKKMAKPRGFRADGTVIWWDEPENITRLEDYQDQDVRTEGEADTLLPPLTSDEFETWVFDQTINERGVYIDRARVETMAHMVTLAKKQADATMRALTSRSVPTVTNVPKFIDWLNERGIPAENLRKQNISDLEFWADVKDDRNAADAIELRKNTAKTSTSKYAKSLECVSLDGRIRGLLNYHGANTGRWAGRLVQPHNYPRLDEDEDIVKVEWLHSLLDDKSNGPREVLEYIDAVYGPLEAMRLLSLALRSTVEAAPGNILIGGDFSNIEGRVNAWIADETWKLDAFRAYDKGEGPDLYRVAYARSFGVDVSTVGKGPKRQIGKVQELMLGFQGGVGAFFGPTVKMSPYDVSEPVRQATTSEQWERTAIQYGMPDTNRWDLPMKEWTALKIMVDNWRAANPRIVQNWWDLQDAAIQAVAAPGTIVPICGGRCSYYSDGKTLWCVLPSGRMLAYNSPRIEVTKQLKVASNGDVYEKIKYTVWFWGVDPITKQWTERNLYGGLQCENIVQAISRDILRNAMFRVEAAGYPVILTVHDEIIAELLRVLCGEGGWNKDHFAQIMAQGETWTQGLPISVSAYEGHRWGK